MASVTRAEFEDLRRRVANIESAPVETETEDVPWASAISKGDLLDEIRACHAAMANCNGCSSEFCHEESHATVNRQGVCECEFCAPEVAAARLRHRALAQPEDGS